MKVLVAESLAAEGIELLRASHDVDEKLGLERAELASILPDYDALVVRSQVKVDAELIAAGTRLVVIGRAGVGVDNVDLDAATRAGITVVNAPTGNTIAAAEHTLALLYGLARRIATADASMRRGEWKRAQFTGVELRGKTLGIVGLGKIGQAIAVRARAMEMTVIGSDPFVTPDQAANVGVELVAFDDLVARADAITVHVPMTRATRGLINAATIERMKPAVLLLNVARGGILDEADVAEALRTGRIAGAAFDVFEAEPPTGSPLLDAPNTLLTPHLGASTAEAQVLVAEEVAEQILEVLEGRPARYAVNAPLLTPETAQAIAPYLPLAETLGRFLGQFAHAAPRTLTLEIAGEPAAYRRVAARRGGPARPPRDVDDRAGEPRQRGDAWPAHAASRSSNARPPPRARSRRCSRSPARATAGPRRSRARSPTASRTSSASTSTRWTSPRPTRC